LEETLSADPKAAQAWSGLGACQLAAGDKRIFGVMVESHLKAGRQDLCPGKPLEYGQSITDACISWDETIPLLRDLAEAVQARRIKEPLDEQ